MSHPPILFATLGFPGSGKTFFSEQFSKEIGAVHLNSDKLRLEMFANPVYTPAEHQQVFENMDKICRDLIAKGKSVIYDANNNRRNKREVLMNIAKEYGARYFLLYFKTSIETAIQRNRQRGGATSEQKKMYRNIDESVIHRMNKNIEPPDKNEQSIELDGTGTYEEQKKILLEIIKSAL